MTLTEKNQSGSETPTLYNFYESQYDFNNLARRVDSGMNAHISTLKKGKKYEKEFREAVANLMAGVKDGTITFGNGRYNDSLGRYSNAEDRGKDVYGWAADYIYNNMKSIPEYTNQNSDLGSSKKYDNTVLGRALARTIFGTENGNIQYFWDVDPLDLSTNTRGIDQRLGVIGEAILLMDSDNLLDDYSDSDKAIAHLNLQEASRILQDGIQPGETLKLSRIFGGIDWNNWLRTDFSLQLPSEQQDGLDVLEQSMSRQLFFNDVLSNHPVYNGELSSQTLSTTLSAELEEFAKKVAKLDNNKLLAIPFDRLDNDSKEVYLDVLVTRRLLPKSDGVFILPNTEENETVLTYNPKSRVLARKRTHELSYFRKKWINEYISKYGSPQDLLALYFTEFKKSGGILKALTGTSFSNIFAGGSNPNISYNTGLNKIFLKKEVIDWMKNLYNGNFNNYANAVKLNVDTRYSAGINDYSNNTTYIGNDAVRAFNLKYQNNGNTLNYVLFGNSNDDYDNRLNGIAYSLWNFSRPNGMGTGDRYNGDTSTDYIDNALGMLTYSRILSLTDPNIKAGDFGKWGDYWRSLGAKGAYYYRAPNDSSGKGQWIPTNDTSVEGFLEFGPAPVLLSRTQIPIPGIDKLINLTLLDKTSKVYPRLLRKKGNFWRTVGGLVKLSEPDILGTGRLIHSINTNNRIAKTLTEAIKPHLMDTYERYSPITGDFGYILFKNQLAADVRRQASKPFTSDASLQLAGQLDANKLATSYEQQGFLKDEEEIRRTKDEALNRQEDNMKRRSDVTNYNRKLMIDALNTKAQIEATRKKQNWQSIDNYLSGFEKRFREGQENRNAYTRQAVYNNLSADYLAAIQKLNSMYKLSYPNRSMTDRLNDPDYLKAISRLKSSLNAQTLNIGTMRVPLALKTDFDSFDDVLQSTSFKKGGSLRPSIITMINKVIKNESYT